MTFSLNKSSYGLQMPQSQNLQQASLLPTLQQYGNVSPPSYDLFSGMSGGTGGLGLQAGNLGNIGNLGKLGNSGNSSDWFTMDSFLGKDGKSGWGGLALGALQGVGSAFMGMKQYGLAKDALQESKSQFSKNYEAQRSTINSAQEDRQRARVAATEGGAESVDSYMERNRIK